MPTERGLFSPLADNFLFNGSSSMEMMPARTIGIKKGRAKYKPAKTRNIRKRICTDLLSQELYCIYVILIGNR